MESLGVQTVDIYITQGDCLNKVFTFTDQDDDPVDVSGWEFYCQVRDLYDSADIVLEPVFSAAGLDTNQVRMTATAAETLAIEVPEASSPGKKKLAKYSYDVKAVHEDGCTYTIQEGTFFVNPAVSKEP